MSRFLSCDWGSSTFRIRLIDAGSLSILTEYSNSTGISEISRQWDASHRSNENRELFFRSVLSDFVHKLNLPTDDSLPIFMSGMASSSIGMSELPYQQFPFRWDPLQFITRKIDPDEYATNGIFLISGFRTDDDVMRGEETMLLGTDDKEVKDSVIIFPGTHSKHVYVQNGIASHFKTFMTGELFSLLSEHSILRNAVKKGKETMGFEEGFRVGITENILHGMFLIRTRQLLQKTDPEFNYQFLSGMLIAAELRELKEIDRPVFLACSENLRSAYTWGLEMLNPGTSITIADADELLVKGHDKLARQFL